MHPAQSWLARLLDDLRRAYSRSYKESVRLGDIPLEKSMRLWGYTLDSANNVVRFADLLTASKLRYRATRVPLDVPRVGPLEKRFDWTEILHRNPWMVPHQAAVTPVIEELVRQFVTAEVDLATRRQEMLTKANY